MYAFYGAYNHSGIVRKVHYRQCQCGGYISSSRLLDLRAEESRVIRHVKPLHCGEASRKPKALSWVQIQAIGALAQETST